MYLFCIMLVLVWKFRLFFSKSIPLTLLLPNFRNKNPWGLRIFPSSAVSQFCTLKSKNKQELIQMFVISVPVSLCNFFKEHYLHRTTCTSLVDCCLYTNYIRKRLDGFVDKISVPPTLTSLKFPIVIQGQWTLRQ